MARNPNIAADRTLARAFPSDIPAPQLLFDFTAWLAAKSKRQLGVFRVKPRSANDYVPAGVPIARDFALFVELSEGSAGGLWFVPTRDPMRAPFVVLGSEGDLRIYAPNLACFIHRIAIDAFEEGYLEVYAAGDHLRVMLICGFGDKSRAELEDVPPEVQTALRPHLWNLRERFAQDNPGEGLWPVASLTLDGEAQVSVEPMWSHGYPMGYADFPREAFQADQRRSPRSTKKLAKWH
ncbi:MAG: hypothetical protein AAFQ82_06740 [Myxococcota bacterium]